MTHRSLKTRPVVEKLVSYLVDPPPADADPKREYKYPYLACEIFSCEIDAILSALTDDDCALFSRVMAFIDVPVGTRLNSMLAGYFSKTVACLVSRRQGECVAWFQANPRFVDRLVEHVGVLAVAEVLLRLVGADDPGSMMPMQSMLMSAMGASGDQSAWLADTPLLDRLLDALDAESSSFAAPSADGSPSEGQNPEDAAATRTTRQANAAEVLVGIARGAPSALAAKLSGKEAMSKLFDRGLRASPGQGKYGDGAEGKGGNPDGSRVTAHDGASSSPLVNVLDIAIAIVDAKRAASGPMQTMRAMLAAETGGAPASSPPPPPPEALDACVRYLEPLVAQLDVSGDGSSQRTTWGTITPPLGMRRVKIVDMIATIVGCKDDAAATRILETGALVKCAELFVRYPFNNFLHHHFENAVAAILDWGHPALVSHLFASRADGGVDLVGVIVDSPRTAETTRGPVRAGNAGHVTRMANRLVAVALGESPSPAPEGNAARRTTTTRVGVGVGGFDDPDDDDADEEESEEGGGGANREAAAERSRSIAAAALDADARWRAYVDGELGDRNQIENVYKWACGRPAGMDDLGLNEDDEEDGDFDIGLGAGFSRDSYHRYGGADDDDDDDEDEDGADSDDAADDDDLDPLTARGAALLFQGDANARLASLTLGRNNHPDVMIEELGEEMDSDDDDRLDGADRAEGDPSDDADTVQVPASVVSMFARSSLEEGGGTAGDDDDDVILADSDDEGQTLTSPKSPDAKSEKVEHDAPELMREYGSSNFWGSAIDDSLVPDDI